jgi:ESCRT-I complex subunit TSG101
VSISFKLQKQPFAKLPLPFRLLDLVAEDNALEDTVYHLGRAFNSDTRTQDELERFLKRIRLLSREQFMKRALINKILLELALAKAQQGH